MGRFRRWSGLVTALVVAVALAPAAHADSSPAGRLVSEVAASGTPHVLDGRVLSITQVGNTILLGGTFDTARNDNSQTVLTRANLLSFNATTGQINTAFVPNPNGTVQKVVDAGDGETVYVAGNFTSLSGVARTRVARIRISDGSVVQSFNAGNVTGQVRDMALRDGRLWIGGAFTHVGNGTAQRALATLNPATGARTPFMSRVLAGNHNDGVTQVLKFDIAPNGNRLVAIGNFDTLDGVVNHQLLMLDTSGTEATASGFRSSFYTQACSSSFDSYMRDVDFSPDGTFFAITTTGAYGGSSAPCDSTARFETAAVGSNVAPSWINHTGGDTSQGIEVGDAVIYVGGHFRWQNNSFRGDAAGQGAVAREGLAALDPINGVPYSWNPGRTKGVGVFDFLLTDAGLWVGSDTDRIGDWQLKSRIARMRPDGLAFPEVSTPQLPNELYAINAGIAKRAVGAGAATIGSSQSVPTGGIAWSGVRGAFMINGWLYTAHSDGSFLRRTFDGQSYGPAEPVNGAEQVVTFTDWRSDISNATGMFYDHGRIYFTRTGSNQLFYRYFTAESGVVGARRLVASNNVSGIDFAQVRGMVGTGTELYWADLLGRLNRINWQQGAQSGSPVAGTAVNVSGPTKDGITWSNRAYFLFQDADGHGAGPNQAPTASFTGSCDGLVCSFDASASEDPDGDLASWAWQFGDGATGSGETVSHTYAAAGPVTVTLTVTDAAGVTAQTTRQVEPSVLPDPTIAHVATVNSNANTANQRVTVPAQVQAGDTLVLQTAINSSTPTVTDPPGWTRLRGAAAGNVQGALWTREATASDAGSVVTVALSSIAKADVTLSAYRADRGGTAVVDHQLTIAQSGGPGFTAPAVTATAGSWVSSYWAAKASTPIAWTAPAQTVTRASSAGASGGAIYALNVDSGGAVPPGATPGAVAEASPIPTRVVMFTVAIGLE